MSYGNLTTDTTTKAGTRTGPAFVVPAADPLTPLERKLLEENRHLRRECGRLWLLAHTPAERQKFLLDRLDRVAELEAADERGDLDAYYARVLASFDRSLDDLRAPIPIRPTQGRKAA